MNWRNALEMLLGQAYASTAEVRALLLSLEPGDLLDGRISQTLSRDLYISELVHRLSRADPHQPHLLRHPPC